MVNSLDFFIDFKSIEMIAIYCLIGVILFLLILFLIFYPSVKAKHDFKNFQNKYYKKIRKIADIKDYYLINNLTLKNNNQVLCRIDHILFGEKYIYVIKDRYYRGAISGEKNDNTWFFYSLKGTVEEMTSPMMLNQKRVEQLSAITQIDSSFFISVVIINDNCEVKNPKDLNSDSSFIISISQLPKLIKLIESRDVKKMDEKQLQYAVEDISRLYGKGRKKDGK